MIMKVNDDAGDEFDGDSPPPAADPVLQAPSQQRIDTIQDQLAAPQISRVRHPVDAVQTECPRDDVR